MVNGCAMLDRLPHSPTTEPNVASTEGLYRLLIVPPAQRQNNWQSKFLASAWTASVEVPSGAAERTVFDGSGFPCIRLNLPEPEKPFDAYSLENLADLCIKLGIGAAFYLNSYEPEAAVNCSISLGQITKLRAGQLGDGDLKVSHAALSALTKMLRTSFSLTSPGVVLDRPGTSSEILSLTIRLGDDATNFTDEDIQVIRQTAAWFVGDDLPIRVI